MAGIVYSIERLVPLRLLHASSEFFQSLSVDSPDES